MPRKGRKPRQNSDSASEEPVTPETQSPKPQPQSEPRPQAGTIASAKQALRRASSSSPVSSVKPVEVEPGTVASAKELLKTASAEMAKGHNDKASPNVSRKFLCPTGRTQSTLLKCVKATRKIDLEPYPMHEGLGIHS